MSSVLPIPIRELLKGVEALRVEFKSGWNTGPTAVQVLRTICAFANDYYNVNGGYVVLGVEDDDGRAKLPPKGLHSGRLEDVQRQILDMCRQLRPVYRPIVSAEEVDGKHLLAIWVPASRNRPHSFQLSADGTPRFFVRMGAQTRVASDLILNELVQMTAPVPFDDDQAMGWTLDDLHSPYLRQFLRRMGNEELLEIEDDAEIYRVLGLTTKVNAHEVPKNAALLFFHQQPDKLFPGAWIRFARFRDGAGGDLIEEMSFRGPLYHQIDDCLRYLKNTLTRHIRKHPDRPEASVWMDYPEAAVEEAVVNAVHHRDYRLIQEPTLIRLFPDELEITSYPGPVPGPRQEDFHSGRAVPLRPARNRLIGELLRRIRLAEKLGSGVPKIWKAMERNGSPKPSFDFDETHFVVVLPVRGEVETHEYDVFFSHQGLDRSWVLTLVGHLRRRGYRVFLDEGQPENPFIDALERSRGAVLAVTAEAVESGWVRTEYEKLIARSRREPDFRFVPIAFGDLPELPFLEDVYWVDFRDPSEATYRRALYQLIARLEGQVPLPDATIEVDGELAVPTQRETVEEPRPEAENVAVGAEDPLVAEVFGRLAYSPILLLLAQAGWGQSHMVESLKSGARARYGANVLHITPAYGPEADLGVHFARLGRQCGFEEETNSPVDWEEALERHLRQGARTFLMVTGFENSSEALRKTLTGILLNLVERYGSSFQVILCGGERLAELKYAPDFLSLLARAERIDWPELTVEDVLAFQQRYLPQTHIDDSDAAALLELSGGHPGVLRSALRLWKAGSGALSEEGRQKILADTSIWQLFTPYRDDPDARRRICQWLDHDDLGPVTPWSADSLLRKLYWSNLLTSRGRRLTWRCELLREAGRWVLECADCPRRAGGCSNEPDP